MLGFLTPPFGEIKNKRMTTATKEKKLHEALILLHDACIDKVGCIKKPPASKIIKVQQVLAEYEHYLRLNQKAAEMLAD